jgi:hypothetical protein
MTRPATPLRAIALLAALSSMPSLPGRAHAQEAPLPPPTVYLPPPPVYYAPSPSVLPVDPVELEQRGHRKKVAGAILMGVGAVLSVVGAGFAIDGALHAECSGHEEHAVCKPSSATAEVEGGSTALLLGQVMTVVGVPVYIVGGRQVARARRLSAQLALQPLVGGAQAGAIARVDLRF